LSDEQFVTKVKELTGGKGVDYILDPVCGPVSNFEKNVACLGLDSQWVIYGFLGGF